MTVAADFIPFECAHDEIFDELNLKKIGEEENLVDAEGMPRPATHCEFVKSNLTECPDEGSVFHFTRLYYCQFEEFFGVD